MSDPIVPALEYFLSLEQVPGFDRRKSRLESEPARPKNQNFGIRSWASHCAELGAICLLDQQLELPIVGFDQRSPRASRPNSDCGLVAEVGGDQTFFEVKRRTAEDMQTPPQLLVDRLLELNPPYSLSIEMLDVNYDCQNIDAELNALVKHIDSMEDAADVLMCRVTPWARGRSWSKPASARSSKKVPRPSRPNTQLWNTSAE